MMRFKFLAACCTVALSASAASAQTLYLPPAAYLHEFVGKVTVMPLPHKAGNPMLSLSSHAVPGHCAVWLPNVGDPEITSRLRECLWKIELANCNGAVDVNTPAVRARLPARELARYSRQAC